MSTPRSAVMEINAPARAVRPLRILMVLTGISSDGGAEVQTVQLAVRLKRRGWDVAVVSLMPIRRLPMELIDAGIPFESADMRSGLHAMTGLGRLAACIRRRKPHVVHSHMTYAVLAARLARAVSRVPVVIGTLHGLHMYNVSGGGYRLRELAHRASPRALVRREFAAGKFRLYRCRTSPGECRCRRAVRGLPAGRRRSESRRRVVVH